jgi:ABC-type multidrug transport system fused ATPase/permease subunit
MTSQQPADDQPKRTAARVAGLLAPERGKLIAVAFLCVFSVGSFVAGPAILGIATNILFDGIVSKLVPQGVSRERSIALLRARGHGSLADIFAAMHVQPGAGVDFSALGFVLVLAAVLYALSSTLGWCQGYLLAGISERTAYRLRRSVEDKLGRLPLRYFDQNPHGDLLSRVANDVGNVDTAFQEALSQLPTLTFAMLGVLVIMFVINPLLALISLVSIPLVLVAASLIAGRSKSRFDAQWEQTGQLTGLVEESFAGHALVLAFGQQRQMEEEFRGRNQRLARVSFRAQFLSGIILPIVMFVGNINYVAIAVIGGYWVATGAISLGAVQAFIQYSRQLSTPIAQFAGQLNSVQSGLASAERVFAFLDAPEETAIVGGASVEWAHPAARSVRLEHVCFRYAADTPLIEDFTLEAEPGQTVAIVGPTGAGKTTLVNLLVRF